jgi:hypothetical protein
MSLLFITETECVYCAVRTANFICLLLKCFSNLKCYVTLISAIQAVCQLLENSFCIGSPFPEHVDIYIGLS